VKSTLVVHQGAIGDFILSLPPLEAIHRFYSQTRFIFLGNPSILEIIHSRPYFDVVLNCAEKRWAPLYNSKGKLETGVFDSLPRWTLFLPSAVLPARHLLTKLQGYMKNPHTALILFQSRISGCMFLITNAANWKSSASPPSPAPLQLLHLPRKIFSRPADLFRKM